MGYTTLVAGEFTLDRPLAPAHLAIPNKLARDEHTPGRDGKPAREAASGRRCPFCHWVPKRDGAGSWWDGGEKFYGWLEWLQYLVDQHLRPWGYVLSGEVRWRGEDIHDAGVIYANGNRIEAVPDVNPGPSWARVVVPATPIPVSPAPPPTP